MSNNPFEGSEAAALAALPARRLERLLALRRWMLEEARREPDTNAIVEGVGQGLRAAGVPLERMVTIVEVRHSERWAVVRAWNRGKPAEEVLLSHMGGSREALAKSPFHAAHDAGGWVHLYPTKTNEDAYPIVPDLRAAGVTHYVCVPVLLPNGMRDGFSFATSHADGFSEADLFVLKFIEPTLAALLEILVTRRILAEVTRIYLGVEPGARVLSGDVRRGEVIEMGAAIMFADMRDFTGHSMHLSTRDTVALLNAYYDCVVAPVEARGGEVLKFIADGVLAIFHIDDDPADAARRGLQAGREALQRVAALNANGGAPARFEIGIALHVGLAAYGNVGSGERQDYTVIGSDVNIASRIASECGARGEPLLMSEALNKLLPGPGRSLGGCRLKGVTDEMEIFAPLA